LVRFIDEHKDRADGGRRWGVESICRVLCEQDMAIAPATYYAAKARPPSRRSVRDMELKPVITAVHVENYGVYGARKMQAALRREKHIEIGRDQTARLMRELGLTGVRRGKVKRTTVADQTAARPADLVDRNFHAEQPDQLWIVDLTYIRTWVGFGYLALVIDVFSRRILGWALTTHMRTALPLEALEMAIWTRQRAGTKDLSGLIHHGDRGSQYMSIRYTERLAEAGAVPSVGSRGDSYDKACASHCTSWRGLGWNSVSDRASLPGDEPWVSWGGRFEEPDVLVVAFVRDEQSGPVPVLDRRLVHVEPFGEFADGEQASRVQSLGVAGQVVGAA
jgi:putative transposase